MLEKLWKKQLFTGVFGLLFKTKKGRYVIAPGNAKKLLTTNYFLLRIKPIPERATSPIPKREIIPGSGTFDVERATIV